MTYDEIMKLKFFCIQPFAGVSVSPNGAIHPCCLTTTQEFGNILKDDFNTAYNDKKFKYIRKQMLNNEVPPECKTCINGEKIGGYALRKTKNNKFRGDIEEAVNNTDPKTGKIKNIKILDTDIRFSNMCNFKCKMCCERFSRQHDTKGKVPDKGKEIYEKTKGCFDTVKNCYFAGGEPFLMEETYKVIDELSKRDDFEDIGFGFSTNLSTLKYKEYDVIEAIKKLKKCHINCSLDGTGKTNEFIRTNSNFDKFIENVKTLKKACPDIVINTHTVVSIYNIYNIPELMEWLCSFKNKVGFFDAPYFNTISFNYVSGHPEMCIRNLDEKNKEVVRKLYKNEINKYRENPKLCSGLPVVNKLQSILKYMEGEQTYPFEEVLRKLDNHKGSDVVPIIRS